METPRIPRGVRIGWDKERNFRTRMSDREVCWDRPGCRIEDKCLDPTLERVPEQRLVPSARVPLLHLHGTVPHLVPRKSIFKNLRYCSRIYIYHHLFFVCSKKDTLFLDWTEVTRLDPHGSYQAVDGDFE